MKFGPKKGAIVKYCYALKNLIKSMKFLIQEKFDRPIWLLPNRQPLFSSARAPRHYFLIQKRSFWIWFYLLNVVSQETTFFSSILEESSLSRTCYGWLRQLVWKVFVPNFFQIVRNFCCGGYAINCNPK